MDKGLAISMIIGLIIAFVGVSVFIMLVSGNMHSALNTIYCNTYVWIANSIPFVESPATPESCIFKSYTSTKEIDKKDNKIVSRTLLALVISCWEQVETLRKNKDYGCYEVRLSKKVENVTEANLSDILIKEDHCKSIENVDYGCGAYNQIIWNVEGEILSLNKTIMANAINNNTYPLKIPVNQSMIPNLSVLNKKSELKEFLEDKIPSEICTYFNFTPDLICFFDHNKGIITLNITNSTSNLSKIYNYNIDLILSSMEKSGKIYSPVNTQSVLFIKYDASKEAVIVKG